MYVCVCGVCLGHVRTCCTNQTNTLQIPTRAQYEELERRYREAQVRKRSGRAGRGYGRRARRADTALSVGHVDPHKPTNTFNRQRALWATKEALRGKAHALREAKHARAEEERVVRRWQVR